MSSMNHDLVMILLHLLFSPLGWDILDSDTDVILFLVQW